jgi:hypothetical protein
MPGLKGLDASTDLTEYAGLLHTQGYEFAMRYFSHDKKKNLSLGEAKALSAAGLLIGTVWESAGTHAGYFTREQGLADGADAYLAAEGIPGKSANAAVYFAVDFDPTQDEIDAAVKPYFDGVQAAFQAAVAKGGTQYLIGVYGSGSCCDCLKRTGRPVDLTWLSQSSGFAGSRSYEAGMSYDLIQKLPGKVGVSKGLDVDPDYTNPNRPARGFFHL